MNEPESKSDWEDRLVNLALEESLGGQSPPDLSDEILAASSRTSVASLELGAQAMNDLQHGKISRRKHWVMFAAAASLLVAVGMLMFIHSRAQTRLALSPSDTKIKANAESSESSLKRSDSGSLAQKNLERLSHREKSLKESNRDREAALPAVEAKNEDELKEMNIPHIVSDGEQAEEFGALGNTDAIVDQQTVQEGSLELFGRPSSSGKEASQPTQADVDQGQASRRRVIASKDENGNLSIGSASTDAKKRDYDESPIVRYLEVPPQSAESSGGERFRIDRGGTGGRTSGQLRGGAVASERGRTWNLHQNFYYKGRSAAPLPKESSSESDENEVLADLKSELEAKHDQYLEYSKELDSADEASESAVLSALAKPYRDLQQKILSKKQELVELEVSQSAAAQAASSPTAIEAAVKNQIEGDPQFQSLQAERLAYSQQLKTLEVKLKNKSNSPEAKRLQEQIAGLDQQTQEFRVAKESELRNRFKGSPNDMLQSTMMEYMLRKQSINNEIVELGKQYKSKLTELDKSGQTSAKLAIINSEIEQLAELTRKLEKETSSRSDSSMPSESASGRINAHLGRKIVEYQQLARMNRRFGYQDSEENRERIAILSEEIDDLRRTKRRYEAQQGSGPGTSGDQYARIYENPFVQTKTSEENFSTFSIDVDTASYANVRRFLMQSGQLPPPDAVRIEELVNYFDYDYSGPTGDVPFASHVEVAGCPWNAEHRLVRIGIKGKEIERGKRPQSNLVFLIDVSGSMNEPTKLPLLVEGMKLITRELGENDKVAIVVYASSEGLALESTRGDKQQQILSALNKLRAGGSTAGGAGIELAYKTAVENHIEGGVNRVILCTDGDFNVGVTSTSDLERMAEDNAKDTGVFLTVLGFGRGNLNDSMMERISGKGNGNYHYVDNLTEARKVLVEEMAGTLVTIAKDVKIQIDFNPYQVAGYRLLGYENRMLRTEDFNDDKKDAGEIGAGHTVTALYEIVPAGKSVDVPPVDASKYVKATDKPSEAEVSEELLTLRIRYKQPDADVSTKQEFPVTDQGNSFTEATPDYQFASAVASFGMLLRDSEHKGNTSFAAVKEIAQEASERDQHGYRAEFLQMVDRAKQLSGE